MKTITPIATGITSRSLCMLMCMVILLSLQVQPPVLAEGSGEQPRTTNSFIVHTAGSWKRVESPNFRCWCQLSDAEAQQLAESCEAWRERLRTTWIAEPASGIWVPKCDVFVHSDRSRYNKVLNQPQDLSVGSTRMKFDHERTIYRRIDVRADAGDWSNSALTHELTHVVLGERFGGRTLPRWADEGIAMLGESLEKQRERLTNLREIRKQEAMLTLQVLVHTQCILEPARRDAFYGQSLALSSLLIRKSTPSRFADFVEDCCQMGFDQAILKHYQINGISALQQEWDDWTKRLAAANIVRPPIQIYSDRNVTASRQSTLATGRFDLKIGIVHDAGVADAMLRPNGDSLSWSNELLAAADDGKCGRGSPAE